MPSALIEATRGKTSPPGADYQEVRCSVQRDRDPVRDWERPFHGSRAGDNVADSALPGETGRADADGRRARSSKISPEARKYCTELYDNSVNMVPYTRTECCPSRLPSSEGFGSWAVIASAPGRVVFLNPRLSRHRAAAGSMLPVCAVVRQQKYRRNFYVDPGYPCNAIAVVGARGGVTCRRHRRDAAVHPRN